MKDLSQTPRHQLPQSTAPGGQPSELWPVGVKLGIVRLGRAAGKLKYTLLDEHDIVLAREYSFEARLEIDRNGNGAVIFAYAFTNGRRRSSARYLQDVIWESHYGPIPDRMRVVHRNYISMDNRLDNLCVVPAGDAYLWYNSLWRTHNSSNNKQHPPHSQSTGAPVTIAATTTEQHLSLYWAAIQQLPPEHLHNEHSSFESTKCFDANGDLVDEDEESAYYECHYAPCARIEREPRQFSICGRCQETRYCGTQCQQRDWPYHKKYCRERPHRECAPQQLMLPHRTDGAPDR